MTLLCKCGCGGEIKPRKYLKYGQMPNFIKGHNAKPGGKAAKLPDAVKPVSKYLQLVTDEQISYILGHYKRVNRSELARRVGLHKVIFNMVCIELGLRKVEA